MPEQLADESGNRRVPDDWQPRSNIKKRFESGKLTIDDTDAIQDFLKRSLLKKSLSRTTLNTCHS